METITYELDNRMHGRLYATICLTMSMARRDVYGVWEGKVYTYGSKENYATRDSLIELRWEGTYIGKWDGKSRIPKHTTRMWKYSELRKQLKI